MYMYVHAFVVGTMVMNDRNPVPPHHEACNTTRIVIFACVMCSIHDHDM